MTKRTVVHFSLTIERIESFHPSSAPFRVARQVITTTGETVEELPPRPLASVRQVARVVPLRKAG